MGFNFESQQDLTKPFVNNMCVFCKIYIFLSNTAEWNIDGRFLAYALNSIGVLFTFSLNWWEKISFNFVVASNEVLKWYVRFWFIFTLSWSWTKRRTASRLNNPCEFITSILMLLRLNYMIVFLTALLICLQSFSFFLLFSFSLVNVSVSVCVCLYFHHIFLYSLTTLHFSVFVWISVYVDDCGCGHSFTWLMPQKKNEQKKRNSNFLRAWNISNGENYSLFLDYSRIYK